jgi:hypothetical protein
MSTVASSKTRKKKIGRKKKSVVKPSAAQAAKNAAKPADEGNETKAEVTTVCVCVSRMNGVQLTACACFLWRCLF